MAPELRLLLACARLRLEPKDQASLDAALAASPDWGVVSGLARAHGLRPLVQRHLGDSPRVPREPRIALWGEAELIARTNEAMRSELLHIVAALQSAGVPALPYKGPTLAASLYGDVALREFGDLDILVPRAQVLAARDVLVRAGYAPEYDLAPQVERAFLDSDAQYHLVLRGRDTGVMVELHWKTDPDFPVECDASWWEARTTAAGVRAFDGEELALLLCIHGSKHFWASLGWLVDVAELLRLEGRVDWRGVSDRAHAMGCARRVGVGLRLASDLLDAPLPENAHALAFRADVEALLPELRALVLPEPRLPDAAAALSLNWRLNEGLRTRLRGLAHTVFVPTLVEWTRWPLPKVLFPAYPLLRAGRLAFKYGSRPFVSPGKGRKLQSSITRNVA